MDGTRRWIFCGLSAAVVAAGLSFVFASRGDRSAARQAPVPSVSVPMRFLA